MGDHAGIAGGVRFGITNVPVAQWLRRVTTNHEIEGSSPSRNAFAFNPANAHKILNPKRTAPAIPAWSPTAVLSRPNGA